MKKILNHILLVIPMFLIYGNTFAQIDIITSDAGNITVNPIFHASMVLEWNGKSIYIDPYGGKEKYTSFDSPDLIFITHPHGDHMNKETLDALDLSNAILVAPEAVAQELKDFKFKEVNVLKNDENIDVLNLNALAVPMYNLPETEDSRHKKGWGNGYVLTIGGKRFYICGDTEDIQEMRNLKDIDFAFICMNNPTMTLEQAADAVIEFKPKSVYPFHFRSGGSYSDVNQFKKIVNEGAPNVEVRIRDWYK